MNPFLNGLVVTKAKVNTNESGETTIQRETITISKTSNYQKPGRAIDKTNFSHFAAIPLPTFLPLLG
ncbi:MAG: hypothetical protein HQK83_07845 [Fibrobacteria bacterium]|nr:hypothetical protein [Fibrobacteria bacterium]